MKNNLLVKSLYHKLSITIISIAIVFGGSIQLDTLAIQQSKKKRFLPPPPPPKSFPAKRTVSASQSSCDLKLVAIAPEFKQNPLNKIAEISVWGQTIAQHPTLWFFIPATSPKTELEFSLQDEGERDIYRSAITTPPKSGTIGIRVPASQPSLQLDRNYHWTLKAKVPCANAEPNYVYVDGWIKRVSLSSGENDSYIDRANKGIWYDAVTSLAQQRLQKPNDLQLKQDWLDLLKSIGLSNIADRAILEHNLTKGLTSN